MCFTIFFYTSFFMQVCLFILVLVKALGCFVGYILLTYIYIFVVTVRKCYMFHEQMHDYSLYHIMYYAIILYNTLYKKMINAYDV